MICTKAEFCQFYNAKVQLGSGLSSIFRKKYCLGCSESCARFMVMEALGPEYVPANLYPGMTDVARQIIASAGKTSSY